MEVRQADPRDISWEDQRPSYRVYFWDTNNVSSEHEVVGAADVDEVLRWAEAQHGDRTFTAYLVVRNGGQVGLARLRGTDPTRSED
jgi:hypothetical protein